MQIHAYRRTEKIPVELFGLSFEFKPNEQGHVVADVDDERAAERLLSISEAYCPYQPSAIASAVAVVAPRPPVAAPVAPPVPPVSDANDEQEEALLGIEALPEVILIGEGKTVTRDAVMQSAFARSGFDREEWNLNDADDREGLLEAEVRHLIAAEQAEVDKAIALAEESANREAADAPTAAPAPAPAANPLVISNGEETIDLSTFSAAKVREFAAANGIELPSGNSTKVAELRLMVAKALGAAV